MAEAPADYEYELRQGQAVVSTGRLLVERRPQRGERLVLNGRHVEVAEVIAVATKTRLILVSD